MQPQTEQIIQYLNSTFELVALVKRTNPSLTYPHDKRKILALCNQAANYDYDPESIWRHCRSLYPKIRHSRQMEEGYRRYFRG